MPPITLPLPDDFPVLPRAVLVGDAAGSVVVACIHAKTPQTTEIEYAAVYLVTPDRKAAALIGRSDALAKDSGCDVLLLSGSTLERQTVELWVTEAGTPGGAGSSNVLHIYRFVDAVPGRAPDVAAVRASAAMGLARAIREGLQKMAEELPET